jgi:hypothetical protein
MAKKKINFDFAKEEADLDALGAKLGITAADKEDVQTIGRSYQPQIASAQHKKAVRETDSLAGIPISDPGPELTGRINKAVKDFDAAPAGPKKEAHRRAAWDLSEGIRRDGADGAERRTRISFVPGGALPCTTPGCNNKVSYEGADVTCPGGKCDIASATSTPVGRAKE